MPELPEVETIVRGLDRELRGETIDSLEIFRSDPIIQGDPESFSEFLCGRKIKAVQDVRNSCFFILSQSEEWWFI